MKQLTILRQSIFAGIMISIGGWAFLVRPAIGMFLFSVGLIGVIKYAAKLYTGTAGFVKEWGDLPTLLLILVGNIIGCALIAAISLCSPLPLSEAAATVVAGRLANGWFKCGVLAIGCGILMSFSVEFARRGEGTASGNISDWLPLLFAIPVFIFCGFPHCIADAFYNLVYLFNTPASLVSWGALLAYYASIVVGNFVGCNVYRLIPRTSQH